MEKATRSKNARGSWPYYQEQGRYWEQLPSCFATTGARHDRKGTASHTRAVLPNGALEGQINELNRRQLKLDDEWPEAFFITWEVRVRVIC